MDSHGANSEHKMEDPAMTEEGPPKKVAKIKTESTGKTARLLEEVGSQQVALFGVSQLKKIYTPDSGSSAYTEASLVDLHHPDYQKKPKGLFK